MKPQMMTMVRIHLKDFTLVSSQNLMLLFRWFSVWIFVLLCYDC